MMTNIMDKVFNALRLIPKGKVTTYSALTYYVGMHSPRVVGSILHKNTRPEKYPCHRVVKSDGSLAEGYAMGGKLAQQKILEKEGVVFLHNRVALADHFFNFTS